jgi:geranylgeranyl reductase family protein
VERCDVVVVGGGPAGSSCAWRLRRAGLDVVVLDKKRFPRDKICAGWVTPQILEALALDPRDYAKERVLQPIHGFRVSQLREPAGPEARVDYGRPVSYAIRRCELDAYLLARSGARLRLGEPLRELRREGGRWIVNGALEAPLLVGAGGHFCPVAQELGAVTGPPAPVIAAQEIEFRMSEADAARCPVEPELPELYFTADLAGYGWVVRKGDWLNVGLGRQDVHALSEHVARFVETLRARGRLAAALPARPHGHAYLLYGESQRPLGAEGVLLVGDAAGLAYPRSGEGIRPAVESGLLAASAILEARAGRAPDALAAYERALRTRLGAAPAADAQSPARPAPGWKRALAGHLLGSPLFARHVVLDRWFLHRREPALAAG